MKPLKEIREEKLYNALADILNALPQIDPHDDESWMTDICFPKFKAFIESRDKESHDKELEQYAMGQSEGVEYGLQKGRKEREKELRNNIGMLRQWLNEKPENRMVTDTDIKTWLGLLNNEQKT